MKKGLQAITFLYSLHIYRQMAAMQEEYLKGGSREPPFQKGVPEGFVPSDAARRHVASPLEMLAQLRPVDEVVKRLYNRSKATTLTADMLACTAEMILDVHRALREEQRCVSHWMYEN